MVPIFCESTAPVLGPAARPATGAFVKAVMDHHCLHALFVPPSIIEQLLQEPEGLDCLASLDWLAYTGGPLSPSAGDAVSKVVEVCQYFRITETLPLQQLVPSRDDWAYIEWNPCRKFELRPSDDDAYELVVLADETTRRISGLDHNYPGIKAWYTKDLFKPHPTKRRLWRFHGRRDDILVLSNGEKFNSVPMEALLQGHPLVAGALVMGQGKPQAVLFLEPKIALPEGCSIIKEVWPLVEQANRLVPGQGQITRSKTGVISPYTPFLLAGKVSIIRKLYELNLRSEIEVLFETDGGGEDESVPSLGSSSDFTAILHFVKSCIKTASPDLAIGNNDDVFVVGIDSLKAVTIATMLRTGLQKHLGQNPLWLSDKTLYSHPTAEELTEKIHRCLRNIPDGYTNGEIPSRAEQMAALVAKYTQNLPKQLTPTLEVHITKPTCVGLTGSTGTLGPYLLRAFLDDSRISRIYCLDRSAQFRDAHSSRLAASGTASDSRVKYFRIDISKESLGLEPALFAELKDNVDIIVHNAWKVDFRHSIHSYESVHIRGIRRLIDWSTDSPRSPRIVFVSSASAVGNWIIMHKERAREPPTIPEKVIFDYEAAQQMGYGESKHVAERILDIANKQSHVPITILQVGQIAGSTALNDPA